MEQTNLSADDLFSLVREGVKNGGVFRFFPRGTSMLPVIRPERDTVLLVSPDGYQPGDVLLYRRENGQAVLHRLIAVKKSGLVCRGDNQAVTETGVSPDAVYAKLSAISYDDALPEKRRTVSVDDPFYLSLVAHARRHYPLRRIRYLLSALKTKVLRGLRK